jgi:hypothetical protein
LLKDAVVSCGGYILPKPRDYQWYPALDDEGEIIYECYTIPLNFITVSPAPESHDIYLHRFFVTVLGEEIGFSRVEFPVLDASTTGRQVALVKLYRAKEGK